MITATHVLAALCAVAFCGYGVAWLLVAGWSFRHRAVRDRPDRDRHTAVTILKPLCGIDDDLERNLLSFFALDHDPLQLVFGAADPGDPALDLVRRIARRHRHRDVAIVVGTTSGAASPKVAMLEALLPHAKHDVILLSDSNVRVSPDEIGLVLPEFADPRVGMVHQPVVGVGEHTVAAAIENLHYSELAGVCVVAIYALAGEHIVNAKGQWVRRAALADVDGFAGVRHAGADDYRLSRLVAAAGWRLRLAPVPVRTVQRDWSWRQLAARHLRHSGLRRRLCGAAYPAELFFNPIPWALVLVATEFAALVPALVAIKIALEVSALRMLRGTFPAWRHAALIPLKDLFYFVGWFASFTVTTVTWRDRTFRIAKDGELEPLAPREVSAPRRIRTAGS